MNVPKLLALFVSVLLSSAVFAQAEAPASNWRYYLKDPGGTRYATLDQINRSNVKDLRVAWVYHTGQSSDQLKTTIECNPLVIDGVMYITSPILEVIALDAATGKEIWKYNPFPDEVRSWSPRLPTSIIIALVIL